MSLRVTVWGSQPSPRSARPGAAPPGTSLPPRSGGLGCCTGRGETPRSVAGQRGPGQCRELLGEGGRDGVDGLVEPGPALVERRPEEVELLVDVPRAHPDDHAAPRQDVEGGELLGGAQRVALRGDVDVGHEPHPRLVMPASHPRVAMVSYQVVLMAAASRRGMAVWSHTAT